MTWIVRLFIIFSFIGNSIYLFSSEFSLLNIFFIFLVFFLPIYLSKIKIAPDILFFTFLHFSLIVVGFIYLIFTFRNIEEAKDFYYLFYYLIVPLLFYAAYKLEGKSIFRTIYNSLNLMIFISLLVMIYEIYTGNHLANHSIEKQFDNVPTAFFTNPNDMAAFAVIFYPFLFYYSVQNDKKITLFLVTIILLLINYLCFSRISFFVFFTFPIFYLILKKKYLLWFSSVMLILYVIFLFFNLNLKKNDDPHTIYERNFNRVVSLLEEKKGSSYSSFNQRFTIYGEPFKKPKKYILGYGFKGSFKALAHRTDLHVNDPHSLPIGLIYNFGFLGALPFYIAFFFIFIKLSTQFNSNEMYRFAFLQIFYFLVLVNIPSEVIRVPLVWIPYAITLLIVIKQNEPLTTFKQNS